MPERIDIPSGVMNEIVGFLPPGIPTDIEFYIAGAWGGVPKEGRKSYIAAGHVRVSRIFANDSDLVPVGASIGNEIHFARNYFDLDSAAGKALLAHEMVHQIQRGRQGLEKFAISYDMEERRRLEAGEDVMGNRYEFEAYVVEARVYCDRVALGDDPGEWRPLYFDWYGCP